MEEKSFIEHCIEPLKKYADFKGRARRKEYWGFYLLTTVIGMFFQLAIMNEHAMRELSRGRIPGGFYLLMIISLALLIPTMAVFTRRMHDIGKSGWAWAWSLTIIGIIVPIVFTFKDGDAGSNKYGDDPKNRANTASGSSGENNTDLLRKYGEMFKDGLLTKEEFDAKKKELL